MARPLRPLVENGIYHVYNRGTARQRIFEDDRDRRAFLRALRHARELCGWSVLSYALLGNHYHLVVQTPEPNLPRGMRALNGVFAQWFNRRRDRVGPLFQGRYGSRIVQRERYYAATLRYVALNPVDAGFCERPEHWAWSGHRELIGLIPPDVVDVERALALVATSHAAGRAAYLELLEEAKANELPPARGQVVAGDREFAAEVLDRASLDVGEFPRDQRSAARPDLAGLLRSGSGNELRRAHFDHAYTLREIALHLGCHYSTVSRRIRRADQSGRCGKERPDPR